MAAEFKISEISDSASIGQKSWLSVAFSRTLAIRASFEILSSSHPRSPHRADVICAPKVGQKRKK